MQTMYILAFKGHPSMMLSEAKRLINADIVC